MGKDKLTFEELPSVLALVLEKVEGIEQEVKHLHTAISRHHRKQEDAHTPMNLTEACEFLKMKRSTMYYHLENGTIPATRKGKNYILFKDELLKWAESGRKNSVPMTIEEREASITKGFKRKAKTTY